MAIPGYYLGQGICSRAIVTLFNDMKKHHNCEKNLLEPRV